MWCVRAATVQGRVAAVPSVRCFVKPCATRRWLQTASRMCVQRYLHTAVSETFKATATRPNTLPPSTAPLEFGIARMPQLVVSTCTVAAVFKVTFHCFYFCFCRFHASKEAHANECSAFPPPSSVAAMSGFCMNRARELWFTAARQRGSQRVLRILQALRDASRIFFISIDFSLTKSPRNAPSV